jgi:hypothetical protein
MRRTRRVWWQAAGALLAAAGPALAQTTPAAVPPAEDVPDGVPQPVAAQQASPAPPPTAPDAVSDGQGLPAPRPVVAPAPARPAPTVMGVAPVAVAVSPACGPACAPADRRWFWQRWGAPKKADCQAILWGYPEEFEAPPLGATVRAHFRTMVANGEAAAMVLYRYDFVEGTNVLNLRGRDQLNKIAALLRGNNFPIVIERTPEAPALAEARRAAILSVLAHNDIALPPERIVIGPAIAAGLSGDEAVALEGFFYLNLRAQGTPLPIRNVGLGGGGGGTGGVGFGR